MSKPDCHRCEGTGYVCTLCDLDEHRCECDDECGHGDHCDPEECSDGYAPDMRRCSCNPRPANRAGGVQ